MIRVLLQQDIQFFSSPDANSNRTTLIVLAIVLSGHLLRRPFETFSQRVDDVGQEDYLIRPDPRDDFGVQPTRFGADGTA